DRPTGVPSPEQPAQRFPLPRGPSDGRLRRGILAIVFRGRRDGHAERHGDACRQAPRSQFAHGFLPDRKEKEPTALGRSPLMVLELREGSAYAKCTVLCPEDFRKLLGTVWWRFAAATLLCPVLLLILAANRNAGFLE